MLAVAVVPVGPSLEAIVPVVLLIVPAAVPVTFTEKVHEPLAARLPPARLMLLPPAVAVMVPLPQEPVRPFGVETINPAGKESVKAMPSTAMVEFGLVMVKLRDVDPFSAILEAPNDTASVGEATTVMDDDTLMPAPLSVEPTETLLLCTPAAVPVTLKVTVQEALAASVPPDKLTLPDPATAVAVPVQVPPKLLGVATTSPSGKASARETPVSATPALGLVMV
jgi:hypothetical protein